MNTFENVQPIGAETQITNYIRLAQNSPGYLPPLPLPGDVAAPRTDHPNNVIGYIEGNLDFAMQAVEGGAHFAYDQVVTHPWEAVGMVGLGAGVIAIAPIAASFGATAAVVAGIDTAVTTGSIALTALGTAGAITELATEASQDKTKAAYNLLTDLTDHSNAELESARTAVRENLGKGTFEVALGAVGLAGAALSDFGFLGKLNKFGTASPKPQSPDVLPPAKLAVQNTVPSETQSPDVAMQPPSQTTTEHSSTDAPSSPDASSEHTPNLSDQGQGNPELDSEPAHSWKGIVERGGNRMVRTIYSKPVKQETPYGVIEITYSLENAEVFSYGNQEGLSLPGRPTTLTLSTSANWHWRTWRSPGEIDTPIGRMSPNSLELTVDNNNPSKIMARRYFFEDQSPGFGSDADENLFLRPKLDNPRPPLAALESDKDGSSESYHHPITLDGIANVISRWTSSDQEKLIYTLRDQSTITAVRNVDGTITPVSTVAAPTDPLSFLNSAQPLQPTELDPNLETPYGSMRYISREFFSDPGGGNGQGILYKFSPAESSSTDPFNAIGSIEVSSRGTVEETYLSPTTVDRVDKVVTRIIAADKRTIRYIKEDGSVVRAVRNRDGTLLFGQPTNDLEF